jgi:hypothetical protein
MSDTIQPVSRPFGKKDGLADPTGYAVLTTPNPNFGTYFGPGIPGINSVDIHPLMKSKNPKEKSK